MGMSKTTLARVIGVSKFALSDQARAILNKYGATMLLPGVSGVLRFGYQPGNYRESTGQTLAATDQQVGLVVDAAGSVGTELVTSSLFVSDSWTKSAGFSVGDGAFSATSVASFSNNYYSGAIDISANKTYRITGNASLSDGSFKLIIMGGASPVINTSGDFSFVVTAGATGSKFFVQPQSTLTGTISNISVRELPGIHASQSTSGYQPVLRNTSGIQSWQFDGTDDRLSLSAVPFQTQDVSFAITAFTPSVSDAAARRLWDFGGNGAEIYLTFANGNMQFASYGGSGSSASIIAAGAIVVNTPYIASCVNTGASRVLRIDGVERGSTAYAVANSTANVATIGNRASGDRAFSGFKHLQIFGKGSTPPTEAELLTLERWAASIQGRTL